MRLLLCFFIPTLLVMAADILLAQSQPTISYTALSDAARKAGRLARYDGVRTKSSSVKLGDYTLDFTIPETARAYDVVPVHYKLSQPKGERRAAVEAVAFEDAKKADDKPLYDLAIPGDMGIKIEYLGHISADYDQDKYIPLTPDPKTPICEFPPIKRDELVLSGNLREAEAVWFKFRITNTGDTILDPEGFGASLAGPVLRKFDKDGKEEWMAQPVNHSLRQLEYIYPGESVEQWVNFFCPKFGGHSRGLREGNFRLDFRMLYRYHRHWDWWVNIWSGKEWCVLQVQFAVTKDGGEAPVEPNFIITDSEEKMPGYVDAFEEFMTAFKIYQPVAEDTEQEGTIYLQVAPWTENVVVKLILTDPKDIAVARIPIKITDENLRIKHNPNNIMVVKEDGKEEPAIIVQGMDAMRIGCHLGPFAEQHMEDYIREMKELGVNVIANTAGNWWVPEINGRKEVELHSASYKYWYDVLMRKYDMKCLGWSIYPPSGTSWYDHVTPLLGKEAKPSKTEVGYVSWDPRSVDMGDPLVPEVIAAWTIYQYQRWGDYWFRTTDGRVPIDIEDTWGWMRDDINKRYQIGPLALAQFRDWLRKKYGTIENVNKAWGSDYKYFAQIQPEKNQGTESAYDSLNLGGAPVYNKPEHVFHDWSPAINDFDTFRTILRMDIYRKANELIREVIPGAELALRTEGANLVIPGDEKSDNMHWRHVYYSQRRNAMVFDEVKKADVLHFHSDYTTLPYTEEEWREGMRQMVEAGVIPCYLPQFDHMRDIMLNPHYGREYKMHYNLDEPTKGMMIHTLMAAYPWWKATYEEGGAPGIIWADYLCDGFATETQKRELRLLRNYMDKMEK